MLNASFAENVRSENGHLFLKALRENVLDELSLTSEAQVDDLLFETMYEKSKDLIKYDLESKYSM